MLQYCVCIDIKCVIIRKVAFIKPHYFKLFSGNFHVDGITGLQLITVVVILAVNVFNKPKTDKPTKKPETTTLVKDTVKEKDKVQPVEKSAPVPAKDTVKPNDKDNAAVLDLNAKKDNMKEEPQPATDDPNVQFKQAFWSLIHQRTIMMDPYDLLYKDNKNKVEGEEYEYLRYTILENFASFKAWSSKLHKVPVSELESINTIKDLKSKLNEIK